MFVIKYKLKLLVLKKSLKVRVVKLSKKSIIGKTMDSEPRLTESEKTKVNAHGFMVMLQEIQNDPDKMSIAVVVLLGLLTFIILLLWFRFGGFGKLNKSSVLILGPSDAGKTLLFNQLVHSKPTETFTSMIENVGQYTGGQEIDSHHKTLNMYDLPGHDRLRYSALNRRKGEANAIIYVIDSSTIKQKLRDSAEFLFNVLQDPCLYSAAPPVLIVCTKQDLGIYAKSAGVIERELAKEIGMLRVTKSRLLLDSSGSGDGNTNIYLGQEGKDFEFSDLQNEVKFLEASIAKNCDDTKSGLPAIRQWIASTM